LIVDFTAFDLQYVAMFAERQHAVKVATSAESKKHDEAKSEFELHYIGAMGEYAVCKEYGWAGAKMDERVHRGGDDGVDCTIGGWDCHVKAFTYTGPAPEFFIDDITRFTAPIGIGTRIISPTRVEITGCISKERFMKYMATKNYGYGERLYVPCHLLKPIDVLTIARPTDSQ